MNVHIARDGVVIGEYDEDELEELARAGELEPGDHYWQEGMEEWRLLLELIGEEPWFPPPPPPPPPNWYAIGGVALAVLLVGAVIASYVISPDPDLQPTATSPAVAVEPQGDVSAQEREVRDRAASDLKQRIERLPARAEPPLNTFYYDVAVHMKKSFDQATPWTAVIRGGENVVDPETQNTVRRTQFTLTVHYHLGEWRYKSYRASAAEMDGFTVNEVEHDDKMPAPPSLVGVLGLKTQSL